MTTGQLDPMIHDPARLRIVATLAALPDGDALSGTRLRNMLRLAPASLSARLRELGHAGYVRTEYQASGVQTTVALTRDGRAALDRYAAALRQLPEAEFRAPTPGMRAGDADRDAAAAALGEHFAQGRLTLDEFNARLDVTLTATTHGELSRVTRDLPGPAVRPARVSFPRGRRARPGRPGQPPR